MKLEIGYNHDFEIRKEIYHSSDSLISAISVLYVSDIHLNRFGSSVISKIERSINELDPTIILLGGDYIDTNNGLKYLRRFLKFISHRKNVFAIAGNHDYFFGIEKIKELIKANNVTWLENSTSEIVICGYKIQITGSDPDKTIAGSDFNILCLHQPIDIEKVKMNYNLVFAGHLHGSQFVFWKTLKGLYPGRLFYKWNILQTETETCLYLISKGLGDTLPVRYNCKKDMLFVEINNGQKFINQ